MRDYRFRGKRIDNGEWVYGYFVNTHERPRIISEDHEGFYWELEVILETVAQFTGSKDKFSTEIYENHIVKQTYHAQSGSVHDGTDEDFTGHHIGKVIIMSSKGVCMKHPLNYSDNTDETFTTNQYKNVSGKRCEVIGDIHSNPELLELKA